MNRRSVLLTLATGVSGLAGCQGMTQDPGTTCKMDRQVYQTNGSVDREIYEIISYEELSEKQKQEFKKAVETGNPNTESAGWPKSSKYSSHPPIIRYQGDYYKSPHPPVLTGQCK